MKENYYTNIMKYFCKKINLSFRYVYFVIKIRYFFQLTTKRTNEVVEKLHFQQHGNYSNNTT